MSNERDNHCRWKGQPGHYEVWYLTANHRASDTGYWIRYTIESPLPARAGNHAGGPQPPAHPYAQLWFASFDARDPGRYVAVNQIFPITGFDAREGPFSVRIGEAELTHATARGHIKGAGHQVRWDLGWLPAGRTHHLLPAVMYHRGGLGETTVLSPNHDIAIAGTITCDGNTVELAGEAAGQTHLWGKKHAHAWAWGHCTAFENYPAAALEVLSVSLVRHGLALPRLTVFTLYLDGKVHSFNEFRHVLLTRGDHGTARFWFSGRGPRVRIEGEYTCRTEDMVVATYHDPDGEPSYCAHTTVADLRVRLWERRGLTRWIERETLHAPRRGHFEVAGRSRDPMIQADHVTVPGPE